MIAENKRGLGLLCRCQLLQPCHHHRLYHAHAACYTIAYRRNETPQWWQHQGFVWISLLLSTGSGNGTRGRLGGDDISPVWRDRGYFHCRPRRRPLYRPDQGRFSPRVSFGRLCTKLCAHPRVHFGRAVGGVRLPLPVVCGHCVGAGWGCSYPYPIMGGRSRRCP